MSTKTQEKVVRELFDKVQAKKVAIGKAEKPCWQTNGNFGYSANSAHDRINVMTATNQSKIVDMLAFLIDRQEKSERAAKELGVTYAFTWLGFTLDEWKSDFQMRIDQLQIQEKRKELSELEARLVALPMFAALKEEMELESLQSLVGNL
jgi:hypothetical protein